MATNHPCNFGIKHKGRKGKYIISTFVGFLSWYYGSHSAKRNEGWHELKKDTVQLAHMIIDRQSGLFC